MRCKEKTLLHSCSNCGWPYFQVESTSDKNFLVMRCLICSDQISYQKPSKSYYFI